MHNRRKNMLKKYLNWLYKNKGTNMRNPYFMLSTLLLVDTGGKMFTFVSHTTADFSFIG